MLRSTWLQGPTDASFSARLPIQLARVGNEKCCELLLDFKANINEKSFARSSTQHPVQLYAAI